MSPTHQQPLGTAQYLGMRFACVISIKLVGTVRWVMTAAVGKRTGSQMSAALPSMTQWVSLALGCPFCSLPGTSNTGPCTVKKLSKHLRNKQRHKKYMCPGQRIGDETTLNRFLPASPGLRTTQEVSISVCLRRDEVACDPDIQKSIHSFIVF